MKRLIYFNIALMALTFMHGASAALVVIGNAQLPLNKLSVGDLKALYLDRPTNLNLVPIDQPSGSEAYNAFYQTLLGWGSSQIGNYWSSKVFSGQSQPPASVANAVGAITAVTSANDSIAYVDSNALQGYKGYKILYTFGPSILEKPAVVQTTVKPIAPQTLVALQHQKAITRQANAARPVLLTNKPNAIKTEAAFKTFLVSFQSLNILLQSSEHQHYFIGASLDPNNPYVVKILATNEWKNPSKTQKESIKNTILQLWQEAIGYTDSEAAVDITVRRQDAQGGLGD